jgi:transketolase
MAAGGGCFVGAALSCVDVLAYLYATFLNVDKHNLDHPSRDYLFLSKGHAVPALYATLVEADILERARLDHHLQISDSIYWHPNRSIPGIEFHSGSLGHLLPVAVGVALDCKLRGGANKVVTITGDGELDEGSNWEAMLIAAAYHLDNLIIVVDRNQFQANMRTEDLIPLEPLEQRFEAFGCQAVRVNGHDFAELHRVFAHIPFARGKPSVVIADTVRGHGLPSIEDRVDAWFVTLDPSEVAGLLDELRSNSNNGWRTP